MGFRTGSVLLILFLVSSCSKSDPGFSLVGTWQQTSIVTSGCLNQALNGTQTCTASCGTIVFTSTTIATNGGTPVDYTLKGNTITIGSSGFASTYSVTATTLSLSTQYNTASGGCLSVSNYTRVN